MSSVPGQILLVLLVAAVLACPLSFELLRRCRNEIWRLIRVDHLQQVPSPSTEASGLPVPFQGTPALLLEQLRRAPWRSATLQWIVGAAVALYLGWLLVATGGMTMSPARLLATASALAWPGFLSVVITAGLSRRQRWGALASGYNVCLLIGVVAFEGTLGRAVTRVSTMWLILNLPATLYLATFFTRRIRAVGPLVLLVTLIVAIGVAMMLAFLQRAPSVAMPLLAAGLNPLLVAAGLLMIGALLGVFFGAWLLRHIAMAYQRNRVGDEGIALSALWLTFVVFVASFHMLFEGPVPFALGLAAFPLYLRLAWVDRRVFLTQPPGAGPALLLLRIFENAGATRKLFHAIGRHWRHVGPMTMIAGHDLAADAIEPNDVMAYLTDDLDERFVRDPGATLQRLDASPAVRDPDGRYRCQQLFCFKNSWFGVAEGLIARSAVILIDLRGLGPERVPAFGTPDEKRGIYLELEACGALGAWSRSVVLHDGNLTKENTPSSLWTTNAVAMVDAREHKPDDVLPLLQLLSDRCLTTASSPARAA